jgi:LCP family protein required for cell wall assembly
MKRIFKLFSFFLSALSVLLILQVYSNAKVKNSTDIYSFLIIGFDNSPANTDVLCIASYDTRINTVRLIQIPRDTYFDYGDKKGKINGLYSNEVAKGASHSEAVLAVSKKISSAIGIDIVGTVAINQKGFIDAVDYLGGIDIEKGLIKNGPYASKNKNGIISLNGEESLNLVRYRNGYKRGDLDRLDMQKIFEKSFFEKIRKKGDYSAFLRFAFTSVSLFPVALTVLSISPLSS